MFVTPKFSVARQSGIYIFASHAAYTVAHWYGINVKPIVALVKEQKNDHKKK